MCWESAKLRLSSMHFPAGVAHINITGSDYRLELTVALVTTVNLKSQYHILKPYNKENVKPRQP